MNDKNFGGESWKKVILKIKKVIVTGGAGFIGSHLCEELVKLGAIVYSIDNYSAGKKKNINFLEDFDNFKAIEKDICDKSGWDDIFEGAEIIFHNAASKKNVCLLNPHRDLEVNAGGTLNLLQLSVKYSIKKFVHASTGSVYGEPVIFPTKEDHPLKPVSYYGVSKLAGERYVDIFHNIYNLNTTILRYFHVYGPRQESNEFGGVVSIFLRNILEKKPLIIFGDGLQVRSFTWVKDIVNANLMAVLNANANGQVYNVASGIKVSILELAKGIKKITGSNSEIIFSDPLIGDIYNFDVSNEKITKELGIVFERNFWGTLEKSLDEFINYIK